MSILLKQYQVFHHLHCTCIKEDVARMYMYPCTTTVEKHMYSKKEVDRSVLCPPTTHSWTSSNQDTLEKYYRVFLHVTMTMPWQHQMWPCTTTVEKHLYSKKEVDGSVLCPPTTHSGVHLTRTPLRSTIAYSSMSPWQHQMWDVALYHYNREALVF